jgi:YD repeat-containing protein
MGRDGGPAGSGAEPALSVVPSLTSLPSPFAERTTWAYGALGRATTITLANGTLTTATFDAAGREAGIRHTAGGTELQSFAYSYDNSGRRTGVVELPSTGSGLSDGPALLEPRFEPYRTVP